MFLTDINYIQCINICSRYLYTTSVMLLHFDHTGLHVYDDSCLMYNGNTNTTSIFLTNQSATEWTEEINSAANICEQFMQTTLLFHHFE